MAPLKPIRPIMRGRLIAGTAATQAHRPTRRIMLAQSIGAMLPRPQRPTRPTMGALPMGTQAQMATRPIGAQLIPPTAIRAPTERRPPETREGHRAEVAVRKEAAEPPVGG